MAARAARSDGAERDRAQAMARKIYTVLVNEGGDDRDRVELADLELASGDAPAARKLYDEVLGKDATSAEALRGAARAAARAATRTARSATGGRSSRAASRVAPHGTRPASRR
jgi:hypothetical protein